MTASSSSAPGATGSSPRAAGLEEAFFREGHSTFPPLSLDFDTDLPHLEPAPSRHADPHAVARRARLRRVFAGVMGFASVLTVVITAKALARHAGAAAAPMGTELTAPQPIVASIDLDAPPAAEHVARKTKGQRATGATPTGPLEFNASRARRQPTW